MECHEKIPNNVKLQLPNGREFHVHYMKKENSIFHVASFVKECRFLFGSIMAYSYKGNGIFLVHLLRDDFCEVDYLQIRTIPRAPVYDQGLIQLTHDAILFL